MSMRTASIAVGFRFREEARLPSGNFHMLAFLKETKVNKLSKAPVIILHFVCVIFLLKFGASK
jgi:hypothetical protein